MTAAMVIAGRSSQVSIPEPVRILSGGGTSATSYTQKLWMTPSMQARRTFPIPRRLREPMAVKGVVGQAGGLAIPFVGEALARRPPLWRIPSR
jgi:hypothetical protein